MHKIMKIIDKKLDEIIPYERNPRKNKKAISGVANSIKTFGFKVPIVIDKNGIIIAGHTRFEASKKLGLKEVPCLIAEDLSEEQIKAFRLADNKVSEKSEWDYKILDDELDSILEIDMTDFGFELIDKEDKVNERERTNNAYNLTDFIKGKTEGKYEMPLLKGSNFLPESLIGFNYVKSAIDFNTGVHFFIDDYQFERIWNEPHKNIERLKNFDCVLTPDFSLYLDMPLAMMIWNTYRSRLIGQLMERSGLTVIPTVSWADERTFEFCFDGLPENKTLAISTVGIKGTKNSMEIYQRGVEEMVRRKNPKQIILYGGFVEADYGKAKIKEYKNLVTERMKK